ncbi:MAG TPA: hypothetical protein VGO80_04315 [Solirubrobacteraceae bacterium]|nr:hypothetical protein [Solirubrobacteraceae bacterium]
MQLIDWADEGGGAYYRDLSTNLIRLACTPPDGPPRSSRELLARLDKTGLLVLWAGRAEAQEIERFRDEHIDACRQRYRSFFDATDGQLDGSWALETQTAPTCCSTNCSTPKRPARSHDS